MKFINIKQTGRVKNALLAGLFTCSYALSAAAPFVLTSVAHADATAPAGNNGTVKINEVDVHNGQGNDPQLDSCILNIKWFGFDQGTRTSTVSFEAQNPTAQSQLLTPQASQVESFTGTGAGGTNLSYSKDYTMSFTGAPQAQGYHVKVTIATDGSQGSDTKSKVYWMPGKCQANVAAVTIASTDPCGVRNDTYTIPTTAHVTYSVGGAVVTAGQYSTGGALSVVITAAATDGYVLGGAASQTLMFTNTLCEVVPAPCTVTNQTYSAPWVYDGMTSPEAAAYPSGTPGVYTFTASGLLLDTSAEESYVFGLVDAGATKLSDIDAMSYKTYRSLSSTGLSYQAAAYVLLIDVDGDPMTTGDQGYLVFEPLYTYGNDAIQADVWQTWDVLHDGTSMWWGMGSGDPNMSWNDILGDYPNAVALAYGFNQGRSNSGIVNTVQDLVFDCATTHFTGPNGGGSGSGEVKGDVTPTPVVTPQVATPAVLEDTGTSLTSITLLSSGLVLAALAASLGGRIIRGLRSAFDEPFVLVC
jgi:hypothetical protein